MANKLYGTDSTMPTVVQRTAGSSGLFSAKFPCAVQLTRGTPVALVGGTIVGATAALMPIGVMDVPLPKDTRLTVSEGNVTVMVHASMEICQSITTTAVAIGAELKYVGQDTATMLPKFATAASGDVVCAVACAASAASGVNTQILTLIGPYKKA